LPVAGIKANTGLQQDRFGLPSAPEQTAAMGRIGVTRSGKQRSHPALPLGDAIARLQARTRWCGRGCKGCASLSDLGRAPVSGRGAHCGAVNTLHLKSPFVWIVENCGDSARRTASLKSLIGNRSTSAQTAPLRNIMDKAATLGSSKASFVAACCLLRRAAAALCAGPFRGTFVPRRLTMGLFCTDSASIVLDLDQRPRPGKGRPCSAHISTGSSSP
jgi:hypothetical protein